VKRYCFGYNLGAGIFAVTFCIVVTPEIYAPVWSIYYTGNVNLACTGKLVTFSPAFFLKKMFLSPMQQLPPL
jgi:hypothetical protein